MLSMKVVFYNQITKAIPKLKKICYPDNIAIKERILIVEVMLSLKNKLNISCLITKWDFHGALGYNQHFEDCIA